MVGTIMNMIFGTSFEFFSGAFHSPGASIPVSILICLGIILSIYRMDDVSIKPLQWLGQNSLGLMLVHPIFMNCVSFPLSSRFASMSTSLGIATAVCFFIAVLVLSVFSVRFLTQYCPIAIGKGKKND